MLLVPMVLLASLLHAGPESPVAAAPVGAPPHMQLLSDAAPGDDAALVMWLDGLDPALPSELRAARIDAEGRMLDAAPLALATAVIPERGAAMARADGRWLVVWIANANVEARFVEDDGTLGEVILVAHAARPPSRVHVVFDGASFLVAWDELAARRFAAARLDAGGTVREPRIDLVDLDAYSPASQLLAAPDGFAFVFIRPSETGNSIEVLRLDPSGAKRSQETVVKTMWTLEMRATFIGDDLFVAWIDSDWLQVVQHHGLGAVISAEARSLHDMIAVDGWPFVLFEEVASLRLDSNQATGWSQNHPSGVMRTSRVVRFPSGDAVVVTSIDRFDAVPKPYADPDIVLFPLDGALRPKGEARLLAPEPGTQTFPAIARNDSAALVVWSEDLQAEALPSSVLAMRVDRTGRPRDAAPILVAEENSLGRAVVASDGADFLVGYANSERHLMVRKVRRDGSMPEAAKDAGSVWAPDVCLAWTGTDYLLAYTGATAQTRFYSDIEVRARRISRDGEAGAVSILGRYRVNGLLWYPTAPIACAAGSTGTLVVWNGDGTSGAIVGHGGTVIAPLVLPAAASPGVAANGDRFLVAWASDGVIHRVLVSEAGTVTVPNDAPIAATDSDVSAAAMGDGFVLAFAASDVLALPLDAEGHASGATVTVSATAGLKAMPAIAGGDVPIIAYQRERFPSAAPRWSVFTRVLFEQARRRVVRH